MTNNISFKFFKKKKINKNIIKILLNLLKEKNEILKSLSNRYKDNFQKKRLSQFKKNSIIQIIGIGGSVLGSKSIYSFLKKKIKKRFIFRDDLTEIKKNKSKSLNLIISKSGNTIETIVNSNILIKKKDQNIFITQNKKSYLLDLSKKLKAEVIYHNDFIGGRYSVLSEVGMLPAELMGLNVKKFRNFNGLIKNQKFINSLISSVSNIFEFMRKKKKSNSVILNYDEDTSDFFNWYQQLIAESLGKKGKGIFPIISKMPKDNHSLMQLFLDGTKNNFYTFFFAHDKFSKKISDSVFNSHAFLKGKKIKDIRYSQYVATMKVFKERNIPFRSFEINKKNEETLGELFTYFILETILLGRLMKIDPYNQPAVELIKKSTKKILLKKN